MRKVFFVATVVALVWSIPAALADSPLKSTNYQIDESFIGGGGLVNESSPNYQAGESIGDTGIGNSSSTSYQTNSGYTTTKDPALTFIVNAATLNFGTLSATTTAKANATFSVIDYTSYGYNIYIYSPTPSNGSHNLQAMTAAASSSVGTEQFGLNVRQNTDPNPPYTATFGANPSGGFGTYGSGYGTPNTYRYNTTSGNNVIATSAKSSGQTNFTASLIVNANATTAGGSYTGTLGLICVGTY
jgi:hypothetical protein